MSTLSFPTSVRPRTAGGAFHVIGALAGRLALAWRLRKANHSMHLLSDEMLHDIGVSRSEIEEVTRFGRGAHR
ncbi:DUF1127 domain-containing protein [Lichenifustis flavocetrariae]|uniref:DUF1127 domain-containing protein n=1 Tax=Lichenifustis flavocetrariae TaxID=2949735 RepID=A0AA41YQ78_9HYPH|nr:DUF1127 domain-containing protein [Lichenifustis flavocetrariae]MCW6506554.1 DUF1127 domain-containing protein [Lichenifustis flavocetrariae]